MANSNTSPKSEVTEISPDSRTSYSVRLYSENQSKSSYSSPPGLYSGCILNNTPESIAKSINVAVKLMSPATSSGPFCRICHEGDHQEDLLSLCNCTGSVGMLHLSCMEKWLSTRKEKNDRCEICNYKFQTIRSPKSLFEWYQSDEENVGNRRGILGDIACFSVITPMAGISAFLCFEGAKRQVILNNSLEAGCLIALATFLLTIYIVWNVLTIRHHCKNYSRWCSINQNVRLVRVRRKGSNENDQDIPFSMTSNNNNNNNNNNSYSTNANLQNSTIQIVVHSSSESINETV